MDGRGDHRRAGGLAGLEGLRARWDAAERWVLWGLGVAAAVGAVAGGAVMLAQQLRARPDLWQAERRGGRRLRLHRAGAQERSA